MDIRDHNGVPVDIKALEVDEQRLASKYILGSDIVLELGARYGSVSCIINSKLFNKYAHVAVEPDSRVWESLELNKKINNCEFQIVKGFISNKKHKLTNIESHSGYATTSYEVEESDISSFTLAEIKQGYNLDFNVLVADCEGFLGTFIEENPDILSKLRMIMFEADYPEKCNYDVIRQKLRQCGLIEKEYGFQNVWVKEWYPYAI
jgi:FkbM family methyltransferase